MRSSNAYVQLDPAVIEQARQMDLLSYLRAYEPSNLKRVAGNVYCTSEHDSLKISNGKWYWWSRGFGGVSALDYLIKVKEYSFVEAVETLTGRIADWKPPPPAPKKDEPKVLLLPPKNKDSDRVTEYLFGRGIDYQLIASHTQNYDFSLSPLFIFKEVGMMWVSSIPMLAFFWLLAVCIQTPIFSIGIGLASVVPSVLMINTKAWFAYPMAYQGWQGVELARADAPDRNGLNTMEFLRSLRDQ